MDNTQTTETPKKKKNQNIKYIIYILIVLVATGLSLAISLWNSFDAVMAAIRGASPLWIAIIILVVAGSYCLEGLIIKIFCRLYTRHYHFHQGLANSLIGAFYNDVTPSSSGGQVMQAYTLKQQGIQVSNAASIMVMWFILYQVALIFFDIVALAFESQTILSIKWLDIGTWHIPALPLIIIGFAINLSVIVLLYLMSFSHRFHNFILHYVIGFLGKIHLIKKPDQMRENLRVQVENFKIELRRLQANIPVTILIVFLFLLVITMRNSIPYFAGLALNAFQDSSFSITMLFKAAFLSSFHQMVTGLIPLPGSAGVSEYFFYYLFFNFYNQNDGVIKAAQILWRTATYHLVLLISGLVSALYRSRPKEAIHYANRQTFVNLQLETFDERKRSADTMFETRQLSRKEIQKKIEESTQVLRDRHHQEPTTKTDTDPTMKMAKIKEDKKSKKKQEDEWGTIDIDN
ncbi:MAG: hypothetical protein BWY98_00145 [Tenericutes bacterium ADurb.BinA155]|jgi:uncharacterized protein (TIRG00374 family)|nr:MAG: hypothetical protein BWY98_00145 [Tenericutes bacterium ADurb.BinA155]